MNSTPTPESADSLPLELLSSAFTFIERPELLRLSTASKRFNYVMESDFADGAKNCLILDRFAVGYEWTINGVLADYHLLEQVASTKFLRFKTTEFLWRNLVENDQYISRISHIWKENALSVSSWNSLDTWYTKLAVKPSLEMIDMISTCRDLSICGPTVMRFLPQILESKTLECVSVYDDLLAQPQWNGDLPVREIVAFLFQPRGSVKHRKFCLQNRLQRRTIETLFASVTEKFMDCTAKLSFSLKWAKRFDHGWIRDVEFPQNIRTKQRMQIWDEKNGLGDNVLEAFDCESEE